MRPLPLLLLLTSCGDRAWEPACIESGRVHACSDVVLSRSCTLMAVMSGLSVAFEAEAPAPYAVEIVPDRGESLTFRCETTEQDGQAYWEPVGAEFPVMQCGPTGFAHGPAADVIDITVTVDGHDPVTTTVEPCWDVSEPNGRCCGFSYSASVTVPAFTN